MNPLIFLRLLPMWALLLLCLGPQTGLCFQEAAQETTETKINAVRALLNSRSLPPDVRYRIVVNKLTEVLEEEPDNQTAKNLLAQVYLFSKKVDEAEALFRELFEVEPSYYKFLDKLLRDEDREAEAVEIVEQALARYRARLEEEPDNLKVLVIIADCHVLLDEFDEAAAKLEQQLENATNAQQKKGIEKTLASVFMAYALSLAPQIADATEVREQYMILVRKAYGYDPTNQAALIELTRHACADYPDSVQALELYDVRKQPNQAPDQALQLAGTWEVLNGDRELGVRLLETAVEKNPRNHEAANNLAFTIRDDNLHRALYLANLALANQPTNVNYLDTRIKILMKMENYGDAVVDLNTAIRLDKENPKFYRLMAECYRQQNVPVRAQEYERKAADIDRN